MEILQNLNDSQKQAVQSNSNALMIIAGAGTGKTTVLARRIAHLIKNNINKQSEIMAVTFTEKASAELLERVEKYLETSCADMWIGTFHSICERILREYGQDIGLPIGFKVINETEAWMLVRNNFEDFDLKYYRPRGNPNRFIKTLVSHFSRCKDELVNPNKYHEFVQNFSLNIDKADEEFAQEYERLKELANTYARYEKLLLDNGALDFGSIILYTHELLKTRPNVLSKIQEKIKHVLVDEFQDTNYAQYAIIKLLCSGLKNKITVVGDDNQSIYRFRGAAVENILQFSNDFSAPEKLPEKIVLNTNYRSKQKILDYAYKLIQHNNPHTLESQLGINKELIAQDKGEASVIYFETTDGFSEAKQIAQKLKQLNKKNIAYNDMAILLRSHAQAEYLVDALKRESVPYIVYGAQQFLNHKVALYCIGVFKILFDGHDSTAMYSLMVQSPLNLDHQDIVQITNYASRKSCSLFSALKAWNLLGIEQSVGQKIQKFLQMCTEFSQLQKFLKPSQLLIKWLEQTQTMLHWQKMEQENKLEEPFVILEMVLKFISQFEQNHNDASIASFVKYIEDLSYAGLQDVEQEAVSQTNAVQIITMHSAKGLEFSVVCIPQLVHLKFPTTQRRNPIELSQDLHHYSEDENEAHMREERRLCYVALTRAKDVLILSNAKFYNSAKREKKPSKFINELKLSPMEIDQQNFDEVAVIPDKSFLEKKSDLVTPAWKPKKVSFSQVQSYLRCPQQFKYRYIKKVPSFGNHALSFGSTIHNTLQAWYQKIIDSKKAQQVGLFDMPMEQTQGLSLELKDLLKTYQEKWISKK